MLTVKEYGIFSPPKTIPVNFFNGNIMQYLIHSDSKSYVTVIKGFWN